MTKDIIYSCLVINSTSSYYDTRPRVQSTYESSWGCVGGKQPKSFNNEIKELAISLESI
jgi:hypothetical protein